VSAITTPPSGTAPNEVSRCTGECCKAFPIGGGLSLEELQKIHAEKNIIDGDVLLDMLIPLGVHIVPPGRHPKSLPIAVETQRAQHFFTCRHFDGKNCGIYETRPDMCKRYPYNDPCEYVDAGLCTRTVSDEH
jgi:Fe-S-cluster containining protein